MRCLSRAVALFVVTLSFALTSPLVFSQTPKAQPANPAFAAVVDDPKLPRVLLLGDSISIGYTVPVRKLLAGKANVHRPADNCGPTTHGVAKIDVWLGEGKWDVIHFNWGLHDLKLIKTAHQVPIDKYAENLKSLVARMKKTGAKLIWASTTPVPAVPLNPPRLATDVVDYNTAAAAIMKGEGVATDDLYAFALPRLDKIQRPANVHFTDAGSAELAKEVAKSIEAALAK